MNPHMMHPWHGPQAGDKVPSLVNAVIEIPKGSRCKYEIDKPTGLLKLDRIIYSSFHYPVNYGFIPRTLGHDGDPLDILVICSESILPLCLTEARVIGNMQMTDNNEKDDKIISVASKDPEFEHIHDIEGLAPHFLSMLRNFFEEYKKLERKKVIINDFQSARAAYDIIEEAVTHYNKVYCP
jgi:inorganic pyrophosphatase